MVDITGLGRSIVEMAGSLYDRFEKVRRLNQGFKQDIKHKMNYVRNAGTAFATLESNLDNINRSGLADANLVRAFIKAFDGFLLFEAGFRQNKSMDYFNQNRNDLARLSEDDHDFLESFYHHFAYLAESTTQTADHIRACLERARECIKTDLPGSWEELRDAGSKMDTMQHQFIVFFDSVDMN